MAGDLGGLRLGPGHELPRLRLGAGRQLPRLRLGAGRQLSRLGAGRRPSCPASAPATIVLLARGRAKK